MHIEVRRLFQSGRRGGRSSRRWLRIRFAERVWRWPDSFRIPFAHERCELQDFFEQRAELRERQRVRAVGKRLGGIVVDFEKDSIDPRSGSGASERLDEFRLAAAGFSFAAGQLDGMSHVEDDGIAEFAHDGKRAHVDYEILVAEGAAAFGKNDFFVSGAGDFFRGVANFPGREELAFFHVYNAAGAACGDEQVRLAAEERGNLKNVADFGGARNLGDIVNIGEERQAGFFLNIFQDRQTLFQAWTAK